MAQKSSSTAASLCGADEDIYLSSPNGGTMLYSKLFEPLVVFGFCEQKWLLVSNSAGLLAWFCLEKNIDPEVQFLPTDQLITVRDVASPKRLFKLQNTKKLYSADQLHRIIRSISDGLRSASPDNYVSEFANSEYAQCCALSDEELPFYTDIAQQLLSNHSDQLASHLGTARLPSFQDRSEREIGFQHLRKWLADSVRSDSGLRYNSAKRSVEIVIDCLTRPCASGGIFDEEKAKSFVCLLGKAEKDAKHYMQSPLINKTQDEELLESLIYRLIEWVEDAQHSATWRSSADDSELVNIFKELKRLMEDANPETSIIVWKKMSPHALEAVTAIYQLENATAIRECIRNFVATWIALLLEVSRTTNISATPALELLKSFASESGGGVFLDELLRQLATESSISEKSAISLMELCIVLLENRKKYAKVVPICLPCDTQLFIESLLRLNARVKSFQTFLELVEILIRSSVFNDFFSGGKHFGSILTNALLNLEDANDVEYFIDAIVQRFISLSADGYLVVGSANVKRTPEELILILAFWAHVLSNFNLIERGLVHTSDINVLVDFCSRQLEAFEIDSTTPVSLREAYLSVYRIFSSTVTTEFSENF